MAVSNAFGSNNFDILLCLGLPWLLSIYAGVLTVSVSHCVCLAVSVSRTLSPFLCLCESVCVRVRACVYEQ